MKKICFFGGNLNHSGGTERVSTAIANGLAKQGYDVVMLNLYEGLEPFFEQHPLIKNEQLYSKNVSMAKNYFSTVLKLRAFLKQHNIETLIVVESMLALFSLPAVIGLNINHITWEHFNYNVDLGKKTRRIARYLSRLFSDSIITLTERDKQIWQQRTVGRAKIVAIPNPSPYSISNHTPTLNNKIVLAVGRLTYQKGFDLLLQAWAILKTKPEAKDWILQIVGEGEDKPLLDSLIHSLNLTDSVTIYPFSNQVSQYYQQASIYCMSSRFEGLPMVLLEAQSFGLPIVSFDCDTGPREIIEHGVSGYLCQAENICTLAQKLEDTISLSEEKYVQMSESAKRVIENKFSPDIILSQWKGVIQIV